MTDYRAECVLFAVALILAIAAASVTTIINTRDMNGAPLGTMALAQPTARLTVHRANH
jgi:hypothetical protein